MIRIYALLAALAIGAGAILYVGHLRASNAEMARQIVLLQNEVKIAARRAEQAAAAQAAANAEAERARQVAGDLARIREEILRGSDNAPIPDALRRDLDRFLHRAPR